MTSGEYVKRSLYGYFIISCSGEDWSFARFHVSNNDVTCYQVSPLNQPYILTLMFYSYSSNRTTIPRILSW